VLQSSHKTSPKVAQLGASNSGSSVPRLPLPQKPPHSAKIAAALDNGAKHIQATMPAGVNKKFFPSSDCRFATLGPIFRQHLFAVFSETGYPEEASQLAPLVAMAPLRKEAGFASIREDIVSELKRCPFVNGGNVAVALKFGSDLSPLRAPRDPKLERIQSPNSRGDVDAHKPETLSWNVDWKRAAEPQTDPRSEHQGRGASAALNKLSLVYIFWVDGCPAQLPRAPRGLTIDATSKSGIQSYNIGCKLAASTEIRERNVK
jgi:hypothetical protein